MPSIWCAHSDGAEQWHAYFSTKDKAIAYAERCWRIWHNPISRLSWEKSSFKHRPEFNDDICAWLPERQSVYSVHEYPIDGTRGLWETVPSGFYHALGPWYDFKQNRFSKRDEAEQWIIGQYDKVVFDANTAIASDGCWCRVEYHPLDAIYLEGQMTPEQLQILLEMHSISLNPRFNGWVSLADNKIADAEILNELGYLQKRHYDGRGVAYKITQVGKSMSGYAYMWE